MRTNIHHLMISAHQGIERVGKEVSIFEIKQNAQVHNHTCGKPEFTPTLMLCDSNFFSDKKVPQRGEEQKQEEEIGSLVIKEHAGYKQKCMSDCTLFVDDGIN